MRDPAAFDATAFLGLSRNAKRDPYRLGLFAVHLETEERPLAFLAVQGGTLIVTDRRVLEFRAHLEVHGAWNVKEFQGYEVRRAIDRASVRGFEHLVRPSPTAPAGTIEDALVFDLGDRRETVVVSRGPEPTLTPEDLEVLEGSLVRQAK